MKKQATGSGKAFFSKLGTSCNIQVNDLISLFEEYKWDWTFHAFREWDGFSPEHVGTPLKPERGDNERKATLQKFFKRNVSAE